MSNNDQDLGNFFQSKKKKGPRKKNQKQEDDAPQESKDNQVQQKASDAAAQEETKTTADAKQTNKSAKPVNSDEAAFMKQNDAYESSDEEKAEINIDADSVIKDTKEVEKQKRLAEEKETGGKSGWDLIAKGKDISTVNNTRADFGTKKPEAEPARQTGPITFKRGSGPPTFKKSNAFGNKAEFPTFEGGKGGKNNNQPLVFEEENVIRSDKSTTGHFGMMSSSAKPQEQPREERRQTTMPVFKGKAKIGGGAKIAENTEESKAHSYDTGFMTRSVQQKRPDGERRFPGNDSDDEGRNKKSRFQDFEDDFNTVTEKKREFKKGDQEGYPRQKKQYSDNRDEEESSSNNFERSGARQQQRETNDDEKTFESASEKKATTKPAQLSDSKSDWSNVFGAK